MSPGAGFLLFAGAALPANQRICLVSWPADLLDTPRSFTSGLSTRLTVAELAARGRHHHTHRMSPRHLEVDGSSKWLHGSVRHVEMMLWERIVLTPTRSSSRSGKAHLVQ